jgi:hypothetical protein
MSENIITGTVMEINHVALRHKGNSSMRYRAQIDGTDLTADVCEPGQGPKAAIDKVTKLFAQRFGVRAYGKRHGTSKFFHIQFFPKIPIGF